VPHERKSWAGTAGAVAYAFGSLAVIFISIALRLSILGPLLIVLAIIGAYHWSVGRRFEREMRDTEGWTGTDHDETTRT
jgi:hypothetical protein